VHIDKKIRAVEGLEWISALRTCQIRELADSGVIQLSLFEETTLAQISSPDFPGERLIACRDLFLAKRRAAKRPALLAATEKELKKIAEAVRHPKRALRGKEKVALRVGRAIGRFKMAKHFILEIEETDFQWQRNQEKIKEEAALDEHSRVVKEHRSPRLAHVPPDVVGENAQEDVGAHAIRVAVVDGAHLQIDGLDASECLLDAPSSL